MWLNPRDQGHPLGTESLWVSPAPTKAIDGLRGSGQKRGREENTVASAFLVPSNYLPGLPIGHSF